MSDARKVRESFDLKEIRRQIERSDREREELAQEFVDNLPVGIGDVVYVHTWTEAGDERLIIGISPNSRVPEYPFIKTSKIKKDGQPYASDSTDKYSDEIRLVRTKKQNEEHIARLNRGK